METQPFKKVPLDLYILSFNGGYGKYFHAETLTNR